jgi:mRNA-degrading endonuclease RelE of RelBE toxin-antitoxin system
MKHKIVFTKTFEKGLKKLTLSEQKIVSGKLKLLQENPFHPSLRC